MRNFWNQIPGLRLVIVVIAGVGIEIYSDAVLYSPREVLWFMVGLFVMTFIVVITLHQINSIKFIYRFRLVNGVALSLFLVSFGYIHTWLYSEKNYDNHFKNFLSEKTFMVATIVKPPLEKEKIVTVVAEVGEVMGKSSHYSTRGRVLMNVLRDSLADDLYYGDQIVFNAQVQEFDEPQNPEEFSFKLYQSFHNVYHRTFIKPGDWKLVARDRGNFFMATVHQSREYFLSLLMKYVKHPNDFGVASSIMLGYSDYRNGEITRAYATSGALHVLSVSGLHVGIIFFMLNAVFGRMDKLGRRWVIAKAIIIVVLIWFYACLTGLCPSVLRSATMFSMIQIGRVMIRNVNTYNVIATSALVLILFNPFIVTEVGFRLSYLAVIGIIYLQPKIYALVTVHNSLLDKAWAIIAVSLAAQIATFPLGLYYFHQFPVLFLISNLVVIPAGYLILTVGTTLCMLGEVAYLNDIIGWVFNLLLIGLNKFIFFIDSLSFALIQGISIAMVEMILIYVVIFLLCWLTEEGRPRVLLASLIIVLGLSSFNAYEAFQQADQKQLVVYSVPKSKAVALICGKKVMYDFDEKLIQDESSMLFHVRHHWWSCGITEEKVVESGVPLDFGKLLVFEGKKILLIDSALGKWKFEMERKLKVDVVIISNNPKVSIKELVKYFKADRVIFDSSNRKWRTDKWIAECNELGIYCWDVNTNGAYVQKIKSEKQQSSNALQ